MKPFRFLPVSLRVSLVVGCLGLLTSAQGADNKSSAKSSASTNSSVLEVSIPQSVFDFGGKGVKDPFFPLSTRSAHTAVQATTELPFTPSLFKLKGMSGPSDNPLALINNRTMATGETAEVTTTSGKFKIHLLSIKKYSVMIRVEGQFEPIEVSLPKGDR